MTNYDAIADLGMKFKIYRKAMRISQKQLHDKTGVSLFTISSFENGKGQGLSLMHFMSLLSAVGLADSFSEIIPDIPAMDPEKMWKTSKNRLWEQIL